MIDIKDSKDKKSCEAVRDLVEKYSRQDTTIIGTTHFGTQSNVDEAFAGLK